MPERYEIASKYLTENEVNAIQNIGVVERFNFFPLLCRLYSKDKFGSIQLFFDNPVSVIKDDLRLLMKSSGQTNFATLVLFIAYDNNLNDTVLSETSGIEQVLREISVYFYPISLFDVKCELKMLKVDMYKVLSLISNEEMSYLLLTWYQ